MHRGDHRVISNTETVFHQFQPVTDVLCFLPKGIQTADHNNLPDTFRDHRFC